MTEIIPAILPKDYEDLKNKIALVRGVAPIVQIDICDGNFVKNTTWPFPDDLHFQRILNEEEGLPFWEDVDFELDLMVVDAVQNFDIYTKLGARRVVFHIEAVGDLEDFKNFLEGIDTYVRDVLEIGVAISPTTPIEQVFSLVSFVDFVQVMGIDHTGFQGEEFDERCLGHIKTLKEKYSDLVISVDGAVDFDTAPALLRAGASRLVSGSAIFNSDDIIDTIERLAQC